MNATELKIRWPIEGVKFVEDVVSRMPHMGDCNCLTEQDKLNLIDVEFLLIDMNERIKLLEGALVIKNQALQECQNMFNQEVWAYPDTSYRGIEVVDAALYTTRKGSCTISEHQDAVIEVAQMFVKGERDLNHLRTAVGQYEAFLENPDAPTD
jgi:hypothetical protein